MLKKWLGQLKCLPCKRKDWSLFIHKPHNKPSMVGSVYNPSSGQMEIKDMQIPIVHWRGFLLNR